MGVEVEVGEGELVGVDVALGVGVLPLEMVKARVLQESRLVVWALMFWERLRKARASRTARLRMRNLIL